MTERIPATPQQNALVVIIGRPSSGKSTFVNAATGQKVSIVSPVPQTTRNAVRGIVTTARGQLVFIDTPGYHASDKKLNLRLASLTRSALADADVILYLIDGSRVPGDEEALTAALVAPHTDKLVVAVNKTDLLPRGIIPASYLLFLTTHLTHYDTAQVVSLSAEKRLGVDAVLDALFTRVGDTGEMTALYPDDCYTDQPVDFRIAEVIREQALTRLRDEIPHALYVDIADMEMRGSRLWVRAFLCVERESQKGMVIGKGATLIKTIRVESIKALRRIFDYRVDLDLQVKVHKNWRQEDSVLSRLIT